MASQGPNPIKLEAHRLAEEFEATYSLAEQQTFHAIFHAPDRQEKLAALTVQECERYLKYFDDVSRIERTFRRTFIINPLSQSQVQDPGLFQEENEKKPPVFKL
ncbi:MAG: hypothetical protein JSR17_07365 [Proteobacteria bacterium]|nr:hypothetical protein [Pseudomonadota bacterium]